MKLTKIASIVVICCVMFFSTSALADYPKDSIPAAPGTAVPMFYFMHDSGHEAYKDGKKVGSDSNLTTNVGLFRYVYFWKLGPFTQNASIILPIGDLHLDGKDVGGAQLSGEGIGDPVLVSTVWLINDPQARRYFGTTLMVTVPVGEYSSDRALNMGANRWALKPHIGFEQGLGSTPFNLSLSTYAEFYTDNNRYTSAGLTQKKDFFWGIETHLAYDLAKAGHFIAVDYFYKLGAETKVNDVSGNDRLNNHVVGLTFCYFFNPQTQFMVNYYKTVSAENGIKTDELGFRLAYFF